MSLAVTHVAHRYGERSGYVLRDVSLTIEAGAKAKDDAGSKAKDIPK